MVDHHSVSRVLCATAWVNSRCVEYGAHSIVRNGPRRGKSRGAAILCGTKMMRAAIVGEAEASIQTIAVILAARSAIAIAKPPVPAPYAAHTGIFAQALDFRFGAGVRRQQRAWLHPLDGVADWVFTLAVRAGCDLDFRNAIRALRARWCTAAANGPSHHVRCLARQGHERRRRCSAGK